MRYEKALFNSFSGRPRAAFNIRRRICERALERHSGARGRVGAKGFAEGEERMSFEIHRNDEEWGFRAAESLLKRPRCRLNARDMQMPSRNVNFVNDTHARNLLPRLSFCR